MLLPEQQTSAKPGRSIVLVPYPFMQLRRKLAGYPGFLQRPWQGNAALELRAGKDPACCNLLKVWKCWKWKWKFWESGSCVATCRTKSSQILSTNNNSQEKLCAAATDMCKLVGAQYLYTMGIYSIVDVHQDGFSRYLVQGCGDGFPRWAVPARYANQLSVPANDASCKNWKILLVFDPLVTGSWQAFYSNENGVRDSFLALWDTLASTIPHT
jgi:hypothetical protein